MRGDQLARQWRIIRAIEASPNGLTVTEIAQREETGIRTIYRDLDALQDQCHAKAQRAPSEIFKILFPPLKTFLLLQHSSTIFCFLGVLARDEISRKAAKFAKKKRFEFAYPKNILDSIPGFSLTGGKGSLRSFRFGMRVFFDDRE